MSLFQLFLSPLFIQFFISYSSLPLNKQQIQLSHQDKKSPKFHNLPNSHYWDMHYKIVDGLMEPGKKTQTRKVFFSTDTEMPAKDIMDIYRTRFQIEFLLNDFKELLYFGVAMRRSYSKFNELLIIIIDIKT